MRIAIGVTFVLAFALYFSLADSLPRTLVTVVPETSEEEAMGETSAHDIPRSGVDNALAEDPSVAPARAVVLAVKGNVLTAGPGTEGGFSEGLTVRLFRGKAPASEEQWVGEAQVVRCEPGRMQLELISGEAAVHDFAISEPQDLPRDVYVPRATRTQRPQPVSPKTQSLTVALQALVEKPGRETVSFGVPFPPGGLAEASRLTVWSGDQELPSAVKSLGPWRMDGQPSTPKSVLVQFELDFHGEKDRTVTVRWDRPRTQTASAIVPVPSLVQKKSHVTKAHEKLTILEHEEPRVLAVLPAAWLCDSWIVGPQVPAAENRVLPEFEKHLQESWRRPESGAVGDANLSGEYAEQQLDRTVMLYRQFARTGDARMARDAYRHATFYRGQIVTREDSKRGRGALKLKHSREELETAWLDVKYAYAEGPAVHYWMTGDERFVGTLEDLCAFWDSEFGSFIRNDYAAKPKGWTERFAAFAWLNWLHAYQVTGNPQYLERAVEQCDHVYRMQFQPPDGFKPDGSWRHSSEHHGEGGHALGSSVWMSALLVDAVFQHWLLTGDERCPHMLTAYCEFAERYGVHWFSWADQTKDATSSIPRWAQPWYYASAIHGSTSDTGGESDHNIDVGYIFLMGYYFRQDPRYLFWGRTLLDSPPLRIHPRMLTWCYRASPQAVWFLREAEGRR